MSTPKTPSGPRRDVHRERHQGPRGARGRPQAARDVHRGHRELRAPPPGLRGRGQLRRRGARRLLLEHPRGPPRRRELHGHGRRARHPGRRAHRHRQVGRGGRADDAPRRREVRELRLQGVGRPPRRGRVGRERAVRVARGRDSPRRARLHAALRPREAPERPPGRREDDQARDDHPVQAGPRDLRDHDLQLRRPREPAPRARLPEQGPQDPDRGRAGREEGHVPLHGRHPAVRRVHQPEQDGGAPEGAVLRGRARRHPGRGRPPVQRRLPGVRVLVREQHQHARGGIAPHGLPGGPHADDRRLRAGERVPEDVQGRRSPATTSARDSPPSSRCGCPSPSSRGRRRPSSATATCGGWSSPS